MENFDYLFYLNLYPDLRKSGILNKKDAYKHYITYGVKEGRICNSMPERNFIVLEKKYLLIKIMPYHKRCSRIATR